MHPQTYRDLANARDFMRHAYGRPVYLPDVAAHANLSPYHFLRMQALVERGALGIGVFETDDIHGDYERLGERGVEFLSPPTEQFYGIEAVVKDNSGYWFSLTQRKS